MTSPSVGAGIPVGTTTGIVGGGSSSSSGPYPKNATPVTATSGTVANATASAILAGVPGKTYYITGFEVINDGATAGTTVVASLSPVGGGAGSYNFPVVIQPKATAPTAPIIVEFTVPIPGVLSSGITLTVPAFGAGSTESMCFLHGYYM